MYVKAQGRHIKRAPALLLYGFVRFGFLGFFAFWGGLFVAYIAGVIAGAAGTAGAGARAGFIPQKLNNRKNN